MRSDPLESALFGGFFGGTHRSGIALETRRARVTSDKMRVTLLFAGHGRLTASAERGIGFTQFRIHPDALIKDETFAMVVGAAALFEIFQDAAVELVEVLKPFAFQERPRFLTSDSAGAKHDDGRCFNSAGN